MPASQESVVHRIIGFCLRPLAPGFVDMYLYRRTEQTLGMTRQVGFSPAPSVLTESMEQCLAEMDHASIAIGVVLGRQSNEGGRLAWISN